MAPRGAIPVSALAFVLAMLDDHHLVVMAPAMIAVPTVITMPPVMPAMVTMLDHDGLSTGNRRRRDGNRAKRSDNVSELSHVCPPPLSEDKTSQKQRTFRRIGKRILNGCSARIGSPPPLIFLPSATSKSPGPSPGPFWLDRGGALLGQPRLMRVHLHLAQNL